MWKKLLDLVREVFDLRRQVKGHDKRLDDLTTYTNALSAENRMLAERVLRLELQLAHLKEQQATERENFRLQLENLILRTQRGLPPGEKNEKDKGTEDQ
jgi:regulator of replication initiation timing